ncbi:MAG: hypothetical protein K2X32_12305, partial [Phycisphaerales bacterium]|nr:hypothetical protein [Phycisphaerales bacterium]
MTGRADNGRRLAGLTPLLASVGLHALLGLVVWRTPLSPSTAVSAASTGFDERVMLLEDLPPRPQSEAENPDAPDASAIPPRALQPVPAEPPTARANAPEPTPARPIALGDPDSRAATTPDFLASKRDGEHNAQLAQTNQAQLTRDRDLLGDGRPLAPAQRPSPPSSPSAPALPVPAIAPAPAVPAQPPETTPAPAITAPMPGTAPPSPTPSTAPLSVTTTPVAQPVLPVTGIKEPKQPGDADATRQQDEAIATKGELRPPDARPTLPRPPEIERRAIDQQPTQAPTPPLTPPTSPAPAEVPTPAAPSA